MEGDFSRLTMGFPGSGQQAFHGDSGRSRYGLHGGNISIAAIFAAVKANVFFIQWVAIHFEGGENLGIVAKCNGS